MTAKASSQIPVALSMKKKGQVVFLNFISEFVDFDCRRLNPFPSMTHRDGTALLEWWYDRNGTLLVLRQFTTFVSGRKRELLAGKWQAEKQISTNSMKNGTDIYQEGRRKCRRKVGEGRSLPARPSKTTMYYEQLVSGGNRSRSSNFIYFEVSHSCRKMLIFLFIL